MPGVVVVTDSTAALVPEDLTRGPLGGIRVVPLEVVVDGTPHLDDGHLDIAALADALTSGRDVTTSKPNAGAFLNSFEEAAAAGAEAVVSIHISAAISGTVESARLAAREASIPVTVVDSRQVAAGTGFAVVDAAVAALGGATAEQVAERAWSTAAECTQHFYVDTLDHLRRGGRISGSQAFFGSMLSVKPLLEVQDGQIEPFEKVRTSARAIARLEEIVAQRAGQRPVRVCVQHLATPSKAEAMAERLRPRLPGSTVLVRQLGPVLGAHVGPGLLAVAVAPPSPTGG